MEQDNVYMQAAIDMALENVQAGGGPFAAIIVRDGEVLARGVNRVTLNSDPTAHAEVQAIREACRRLQTFTLQGCTIYTSCEPCPMCLGAIYWAHLDRIVYAASAEDAAGAGFDDSFIYRELALPHRLRSLPLQQALHREALHIFEVWKQKADKVEY